MSQLESFSFVKTLESLVIVFLSWEICPQEKQWLRCLFQGDDVQGSCFSLEHGQIGILLTVLLTTFNDYMENYVGFKFWGKSSQNLKKSKLFVIETLTRHSRSQRIPIRSRNSITRIGIMSKSKSILIATKCAVLFHSLFFIVSANPTVIEINSSVQLEQLDLPSLLSQNKWSKINQTFPFFATPEKVIRVSAIKVEV